MFQTILGVASGGSKGGNTVAYRICCLNATYMNLSTVSEVCWSPRDAMISVVALVCLWAWTRSIAGGDKWAEVPQSLWHFAWHQRLGLQKSLVWSTQPEDETLLPDADFGKAQAVMCCYGSGPAGSVLPKAPLLSPWLYAELAQGSR